MDTDECRTRFGAVRHAYLATADAHAVPHLVPVTFAVVEADTIAVAIDHKPKRPVDPRQLRRIRNIAANPRVAFLADVYDDDWQRLWWVRADATARVVDAGPEHDRAVEGLMARYDQYRAVPPTGPVLLAAVDRWSGWTGRERAPGPHQERPRPPRQVAVQRERQSWSRSSAGTDDLGRD